MRKWWQQSKPLSLRKLKASGSKSNAPHGSGLEYASEEENAEFHEMFPDISKEEQLIFCMGDPRKRLYVSEKDIYIIYNKQKILIPMHEIIYVCILTNSTWDSPSKDHVNYSLLLETGRHRIIWKDCTCTDNYIFKAFDTIRNLWRVWMHNKEALEMGVDLGTLSSKQSLCMCSKEGRHGDIIMDGVFVGTPKEIHNLMFVQNHWCPVGEPWTENEIQVSDWALTSGDSPQGHVAQTINWKKASSRKSLHNEVVHYDLDDYISVVTTKQGHDKDHEPIHGITTQCIMWESVGSSRIVITGMDRDGGVAAYSDEAILDRWFLHVAGTRLHTDKVHASIIEFPRADKILLALEPARVPFVLDLLQNEVNTTHSDFKYHGQCMRLIYLLVNKHQTLPAVQIHTAKVVSLFLSVVKRR
ncbi:hypothetical protein L218DRAFT_1008558 [Marasmius fiardii PR-910]|nr:hypothetical protein L218DRAFT_1008558 [Marasmius fiardii PR-910]